MEIDQVKKNNSDVITLSGRLDANTASTLDNVFASIVNNANTKIIVNCEHLDYISSAGLRVLLTAAKELKKHQGKIAICCLNPNVKQVFEISGFTSIFPILNTEEEALATIDQLQI